MIIAAPLASLVIVLSNRMNILETMLGKEHSYIVGLTDFLFNNFALFMLGSILAKYMEASGVTQKIANTILRLVGKDSPFKVMLAITIIASVLTYGGVSIFVVIFTLLPLPRPLFKELNINWALFPIPVFLGASTYTMTSLLATPSIHNAIPTKVLGTSLTAAPVLSIVASLTLFIFGVTYMSHALKKSLANGESYQEAYQEEGSTPEDLPNLFQSILPLLALMLILLFFSKIPSILVIGLSVSICLSALIFYCYLPNQKDILNSGATTAILPAFATSSTVAFGTVLVMSTGFSIVQDWIQQIPGTLLNSLALTTALVSGVIGSSSGAVGIVTANILPTYLEMGLNPEVLHRVTVVASAVLTVVPQSGVMITFHDLSKLILNENQKQTRRRRCR